LTSTSTSTSIFAGDGTIGAIGCSLTVDSVAGYISLGGTRIWNIRGDYPGGAVGLWAKGAPGGSGLWDAFDQNLAQQPETSLLWWQLCTLNGSPRDGLESALIVLDALYARIPNATIYVSPQPDYEPAGICDISGPTGPAFMAEVSDQLVSQYGIQPGPVTGPLGADDTIGGCHANESGQELLGTQLLAFFGAS
jgi:hypothetical protein